MEINGKTEVCALIGDPVEHTLSPLIHNTIAETEGIDTVYAAFHVKKGNTEAALKGAHALGIRGFNVTVPHKEAVIPFLSDIDPMAEAIGAVNTLTFNEKGYKGYNTDAVGFVREIRSCGFDIKGEGVVMIGAGGAANAVLNALYFLGAKEVYILNRSAEKAEQKFGEDERNKILSLNDFERIPGDHLFCVQCTSVGLSPDNDRAPIEDKGFYKKIDRAIDIIYRPAETKFMKLVRSEGGRAENGLDMLIYQAVESFKLFHNTEVSERSVDRVREKLKDHFGETG